MNEDDLGTQLRRELDATPAWQLDIDEAARRASRHHRERKVLTAVSVVFALGVTAVSLVALSSVGQGPRGTLGTTPSGAPGTSSPPATTEPTGSTEARFVCDGTSTVPAEFTVAAGPAGIRIVVDNTSGAAMGFDDEHGGVNAPPGQHLLEAPTGGHAWALPPGDHQVKCVPNSATDPDTVPAATLRVVDPNGFWVADELQCGGSNEQFGFNADFVPGSGMSLDDAVHRLLDGYAVPGDVIVHVGYPEAFSPEFALTRDGRPIVIAHPAHLGGDRWLPSEATGCSGEDRLKGGFHAPIRIR